MDRIGSDVITQAGNKGDCKSCAGLGLIFDESEKGRLCGVCDGLGYSPSTVNKLRAYRQGDAFVYRYYSVAR